jgi:hypothetical protein
MKHFLFLLLFSIISITSFSQNRITLLEPSQSIELRDSVCNNCDTYTILEGSIDKLFKEKPNSFELPLTVEGNVKILKLSKIDLTTENFKINTSSGRSLDAPEMLFYAGGYGEEQLTLSLSTDALNAFYYTSKKSYSITPSQRDSKTYLLKQDTLSEDFECHTPDYPGAYSNSELESPLRSSSTDKYCLEIGFEVDYDIYQYRGSSASSVFSYVSYFFNQVKQIYASSDIDLKLSEVYVWDTESPYENSSSVEVLSKFRRNRKVANGNLFQLLSFKSSGGIAYVDVLCASSFEISFSSLKEVRGNPYPMYSWNVMVIAHELGHNIGSKHTHACVWNGNGTAIDGCSSTEGDCPTPNPRIPSGGGTIMSYCHITSAGINFNKGFHPQVEAVMHNELGKAGCVSCDSDDDDDDPDDPEEPRDTCKTVQFKLTLDDFGSELKWSVKNANTGQLVVSGLGYPNKERGKEIIQEVCLPEGCYSIFIGDNYGDGLCCEYGDGAFEVLYKDSGEMISKADQFEFIYQDTFCVELDNPDDPDDPKCPSIDFRDYTISPFGGTQDRGSYRIEDNGNTLYITGNAWKSIAYDVQSDINTRIRFEYKSTNEGEIHGVGFEDDNRITSLNLMQVDGDQNWGIRNYNNYPGSSGQWVTYDLPIGDFIRGSFDKIIFVADHDIYNRDGSYGNAYFRNVTLYQEGECDFGNIQVQPQTVQIASFEPEETQEKLHLYPNPTTNNFILDLRELGSLTDKTIELYDVSGSYVLNYSISSAGGSKVEVDASNLETGIYFVRLRADQRIFTKRVSVVKN